MLYYLISKSEQHQCSTRPQLIDYVEADLGSKTDNFLCLAMLARCPSFTWWLRCSLWL